MTRIRAKESVRVTTRMPVIEILFDRFVRKPSQTRSTSIYPNAPMILSHCSRICVHIL